MELSPMALEQAQNIKLIYNFTDWKVNEVGDTTIITKLINLVCLQETKWSAENVNRQIGRYEKINKIRYKIKFKRKRSNDQNDRIEKIISIKTALVNKILNLLIPMHLRWKKT